MGNMAKAEANRTSQGFAFLESSHRTERHLEETKSCNHAAAVKGLLTSCPGSYNEFLLEGRTEIHDGAVSGKF